MNTSNHTHDKGPWRIATERPDKKGHEAKSYPIDGPGVEEIARVYECHFNGLANARLIAAAPDLLDALRSVLDLFCDEFAPHYPEVETAQALINQIDKP